MKRVLSVLAGSTLAAILLVSQIGLAASAGIPAGSMTVTPTSVEQGDTVTIEFEGCPPEEGSSAGEANTAGGSPFDFFIDYAVAPSAGGPNVAEDRIPAENPTSVPVDTSGFATGSYDVTAQCVAVDPQSQSSSEGEAEQSQSNERQAFEYPPVSVEVTAAQVDDNEEDDEPAEAEADESPAAQPQVAEPSFTG